MKPVRAAVRSDGIGQLQTAGDFTIASMELDQTAKGGPILDSTSGHPLVVPRGRAGLAAARADLFDRDPRLSSSQLLLPDSSVRMHHPRTVPKHGDAERRGARGFRREGDLKTARTVL